MHRKPIVLLMSVSVTLGSLGYALADSPGHEKAPAAGPVDCAPRVAWWAIKSDTGHYVGYYVGGGCGMPHFAEPRRVDEGTWTWDYRGWLVPRRVMLDWWHGRRYQGGTGAYQSDGPKLFHHEEGANKGESGSDH